MINNNCRKKFQPQNCELNMFSPTNILRPCASVSKWFQNTTNIILESTKYHQNQNSRHLDMSFNFYNTPHTDYHCVQHSSKKNVNNSPDSTILRADPLKRDSFCNLNSYKYAAECTLEPNLKKNHKLDCIENPKIKHYRYNHKEKISKIKDNKRKNEIEFLKMAAKHKVALAENPEEYLSKANGFPNPKFKNCYDNLKPENKYSIKNNNSESTEVVAIFTLEDFPELPVPKRYEPWSFQFLKSCNSKSKLINKNKSSTKLESKSNFIHVENINSDGFKLKETGKDNEVRDNFPILDEKSAQSNKFDSKNTAVFSTPVKPRQRQISECSDDSFIICFTNDAPDGLIEFTDLSSYDNSCSESEDNSGEIEGSQLTKNSKNNSSTINTANINHSIRHNTANKNIKTLSLENSSQPDSGFDDLKDKKVRFRLQPEIHILHAWDYAYRAARKGDWENYARDRCRFQTRIDNVDSLISAILNKQHRDKIFNERFFNNQKN